MASWFKWLTGDTSTKGLTSAGSDDLSASAFAEQGKAETPQYTPSASPDAMAATKSAYFNPETQSVDWEKMQSETPDPYAPQSSGLSPIVGKGISAGMAPQGVTGLASVRYAGGATVPPSPVAPSAKGIMALGTNPTYTAEQAQAANDKLFAERKAWFDRQKPGTPEFKQAQAEKAQRLKDPTSMESMNQYQKMGARTLSEIGALQQQKVSANRQDELIGKQQENEMARQKAMAQTELDKMTAQSKIDEAQKKIQADLQKELADIEAKVGLDKNQKALETEQARAKYAAAQTEVDKEANRLEKQRQEEDRQERLKLAIVASQMKADASESKGLQSAAENMKPALANWNKSIEKYSPGWFDNNYKGNDEEVKAEIKQNEAALGTPPGWSFLDNPTTKFSGMDNYGRPMLTRTAKGGQIEKIVYDPRTGQWIAQDAGLSQPPLPSIPSGYPFNMGSNTTSNATAEANSAIKTALGA